MQMNDVVNLIVSNGLAVVIVAYFLIKDWKTATSQLDLMSQLNGLMGKVAALMGQVEGLLQAIQHRLD